MKSTLSIRKVHPGKIPNISPPNISPQNINPLITNTNFPPNISPPKNKIKGEFKVQLLNLSKTGIYVNSNRIKRYEEGLR